jgi:hypothetical protein
VGLGGAGAGLGGTIMSGGGGPVWGRVGPEPASEGRIMSGGGGPVWGRVGPEPASEGRS